MQENSARIYRPSFPENQPKTLVFSHTKRAFWACFRENWVYNFGHSKFKLRSLLTLLVPGGGAHSLASEGVLESQFRQGTHTVVLFIYTYFVILCITPRSTPPPLRGRPSQFCSVEL
jgi:hypothetical protein